MRRRSGHKGLLPLASTFEMGVTMAAFVGQQVHVAAHLWYWYLCFYIRAVRAVSDLSSAAKSISSGPLPTIPEKNRFREMSRTAPEVPRNVLFLLGVVSMNLYNAVRSADLQGVANQSDLCDRTLAN